MSQYLFPETLLIGWDAMNYTLGPCACTSQFAEAPGYGVAEEGGSQ